MAGTARAPGKNKSTIWMVLVLISCMMVFIMPALFLLLLIGMLPTWVAMFVERNGTGRAKVTAALNLAGIIPFVGKLWRAGGDLGTLQAMSSDMFSWAIVYGSAASAVVLLSMGPQIAAVYLDVKAARYTHMLNNQKIKLVEEWGDSLGARGAEDGELDEK